MYNRERDEARACGRYVHVERKRKNEMDGEQRRTMMMFFALTHSIQLLRVISYVSVRT